jgi:transposase
MSTTTINMGIDVGKNNCVTTVKGESRLVLMEDTFPRTTFAIRSFAERVMREYPGHEYRALVESTGNLLIRVHDTLEETGVNTLVAHPTKTKLIAESRLKNDRVDSEALADLLRLDFVCEAYVPDREHREFRQLTRARMDLVANRTSFKEKVFAILDKYELGEQEHTSFTKKWIDWLLPQTQSFSWIDKMQLQSLFEIIESLGRQIDSFTTKIASVAKEDQRVRSLMSMPGIDYLTALTITAEIADIKRFPTPWKLVSYAGLSPTHRDSSGKMRRGHIIKQGSRWLRYAIVEAANIAKVHDERLKAFYERVAERRGPQKAKVATGKEMLVIVWYMLTRNELYRGMKRNLSKESLRKCKDMLTRGLGIASHALSVDMCVTSIGNFVWKSVNLAFGTNWRVNFFSAAPIFCQ